MLKNTKSAVWILCIILVSLVISIRIIALRDNGKLTIGIFYGSNWEVPGTTHYELIDRALEIFHEKYPDMRAEYEEGILYEDYSEWLSSRFIVGKEPDVFLILSDDIESLASANALLNLDILVDQDPDFKKSQFYQSAYDAGTYDGHQYALPCECNPTLMFVNKTLLEKEQISLPKNDWTWNDLLGMCKLVTKIDDETSKKNQYGIYDYSWKDAICANGITLFNEDGSKNYVTDIRFQQALHFMRQLEAANGSRLISSIEFDLGNVAFRPMTFSEYRTYMPYPWRIKKYSNFEWTCIPMPAGSYGVNSSLMDVLTVGISSRTQKKEKAWELLKILTTNKEIQTMIYSKTSGASPLRSVTNSSTTMELLNRDTPGGKDIDMSLLDTAIEQGQVIKKFSKYKIREAQADIMIQAYLSSDMENSMELFRIDNELNRYMGMNKN